MVKVTTSSGSYRPRRAACSTAGSARLSRPTVANHAAASAPRSTRLKVPAGDEAPAFVRRQLAYSVMVSGLAPREARIYLALRTGLSEQRLLEIAASTPTGEAYGLELGDGAFDVPLEFLFS